ERYSTAAVKGLRYIISAQYPNGGWPQFWPDTSGYRKYITFNDGAMPGIMQCLLNIVQNKPYYSFIDAGLRNEITAAFDKGVECILNCQIRQNGELTAWCQQHDNRDLHPQNARTFEPAAICSQESCEILRVLMQIKNPDKRITESIRNAVGWMKKSAIHGIRVKTVEAPSEQFIYRKSATDRIAVEDKTAPRIWTRFYDIKTNRPIFCKRSGQIVYTLAEVERERRDGYSWYNYDPEGVIKKFDKKIKKY
ncbi:MAG: pectate lyase, partial [Syntrophothermus sp.]